MSDTFQGTPDWYGGDTGIIKRLAERAERDYLEPYQPYRFPQNYRAEERVAGFSPLQQQGFQSAEEEARNPAYGNIFQTATGAVQNALGQNIAPQLQPYIQKATENPTINAQQYMNPYNQAVIENIGRYGSRNLLENILPNVQDQFVRAGQYGSSRHQDLTNRAIRDTQEGISREQANALRSGYNEALQTATGQQERNLQAGQLLGGSLGRDIDRQILGGRELQNLSESQQQAKQRSAGFLGQVGSQQQQQQQTVLNTAYEDANRQKDYPHQQLARANALVRGLPVNEFSAQRSYLPQPPSASPWTQGAGLLAGLSGAFGAKQGFAKGGHIGRVKTKYRHYADGGGVPNNPILSGVNHAFDTEELNLIRDQAAKMAQPQIDPFWASFSKAGFNLAANPHADRGFAKLGQAGQTGLEEYNQQLANQDQRGLASSKLYHMIDNTKRAQEQANIKNKLDREKFDQDIRSDTDRLGIQKGQLGIAQERLKLEKDLYDQGLKGHGSKAIDNKLFEKSNQAALEEARKSISSLPSLKSNLNHLKSLAEKLDTGPSKGRLARTSSTLGEIAGVGKAEDIDAFDSLTNTLVLDIGNQLKGSQVALGKLKIIEQSKPQLTKVKGGNIEIINHMKDLTNLAEEKAKFMSSSLQQHHNAIDVENAFNNYADAKLRFEEENTNEKFPNRPEDFLEAAQFEKTGELSNNNEIPEGFKNAWVQKTGGLDTTYKGKDINQAYSEYMARNQ